jgi:hypothetical protein
MAEKLNKDAVYRAAKSKDKDYFINDGGGLYLLVKSNGTKLWHFVFTFEGKRKRHLSGYHAGSRQAQIGCDWHGSQQAGENPAIAL